MMMAAGVAPILDTGMEEVQVVTTSSGRLGDVPAGDVGQADLGQLGRRGGHGVQVAALEAEFAGAELAPVTAVLDFGRGRS
jgi:hypothetical protein